MSKATDAIMSFLFPDRKKLDELRDSIARQKEISCENTRRIEKMMATLNGEDDWFLRVHHNGRHENGL